MSDAPFLHSPLDGWNDVDELDLDRYLDWLQQSAVDYGPAGEDCLDDEATEPSVLRECLLRRLFGP